MKYTEIGHINEALLVLRHFIDLSARLLPFLDELQCKRNPTLNDQINRKKIIEVYEGYSFDTNTSEVLLNSNVLDLIKGSFEEIIGSCDKRRNKRSNYLAKFLLEHKRLQDSWGIAQAN